MQLFQGRPFILSMISNVIATHYVVSLDSIFMISAREVSLCTFFCRIVPNKSREIVSPTLLSCLVDILGRVVYIGMLSRELMWWKCYRVEHSIEHCGKR